MTSVVFIVADFVVSDKISYDKKYEEMSYDKMTDNNNEERFYLFTSTTALYTIDATTVRQPEWNTKKGLSCLSIREIHDQTLRELGPKDKTKKMLFAIGVCSSRCLLSS